MSPHRFEDTGHSEDARRQLAPLKVGTLKVSESAEPRGRRCPTSPARPHRSSHTPGGSSRAHSRAASLRPQGAKVVANKAAPKAQAAAAGGNPLYILLAVAVAAFAVYLNFMG